MEDTPRAVIVDLEAELADCRRRLYEVLSANRRAPASAKPALKEQIAELAGEIRELEALRQQAEIAEVLAWLDGAGPDPARAVVLVD